MKGLLYLLLGVLSLAVFGGSPSPEAHIPEGYDFAEYWDDPSPSMDFIDYRKYYYPDGSGPLFLRQGYAPVTAGDVPKLKAYFDDYARWVDDTHCHLHGIYGFDTACIDAEDRYFLVDERLDPEYPVECYRLWFYDAQTATLHVLINKW